MSSCNCLPLDVDRGVFKQVAGCTGDVTQALRLDFHFAKPGTELRSRTIGEAR